MGVDLWGEISRFEHNQRLAHRVAWLRNTNVTVAWVVILAASAKPAVAGTRMYALYATALSAAQSGFMDHANSQAARDMDVLEIDVTALLDARAEGAPIDAEALRDAAMRQRAAMAKLNTAPFYLRLARRIESR